jgi:hypothetical protein
MSPALPLESGVIAVPAEPIVQVTSEETPPVFGIIDAEFGVE